MANIGWHVNSTGGHRGALGEYLSRLDAAGIPFCINAVDDGGLALEAAQYTNAPHVIVARKDEWSVAPNYALTPAVEGANRWRYMNDHMPPELREYRDRILFEVAIEPDKARADWLGRFFVAVAQAAKADGYRVAGPSFSAGEPEYHHWESPGMLEWLRYCGDNPQQAWIATHEYSLDTDDIKTGSPYLIGRIWQLLEVCDKHGIAHPNIVISECGWAYASMPSSGVMEQVAWLHNHYRQYPAAKGVCLWTLGAGTQWGSLPQKLSAYVDDVTEYMLAHGTPTEPEEPPMDIEQWLWEQSKAYQKQKGVDVHPEHGLEAMVEQMILSEPGWVIGHNETTFTAGDGTKYGVMAVEHVTGKRPRTMLWFKRPWGGPGGVKLLTDPEHDELAREFRSPVGTIAERESGVIWPGDWVDANPYLTRYILGSGYSRHTGSDLNLNKPHWDADKGAAVHAIGNGVVTYAEKVPTGTWGRLIVIRHETPEGKVYHSRYGHLGSMLVQAGQHVRMGDVIGTIGGAEFGLPNHLHFDVSHSGILESNPRHWPGDSVSGVTNNYLDPKVFLGGKVDGGDNEPPLPDAVDMAQFFLPPSGDYGDIVILANNWSGGQERQQLQRDGSTSYVTKNQQFERRTIASARITLDLDTSPGNGEYYTVESSTGWMPRHWRPGEMFTRTETARFYRKDNCQPTGKVLNGTSALHFAKLHDSYTTKGGITFGITAEMTWIRDGQVEERYFYSGGAGLIAWSNRHGRESWAVERIPLGQQKSNVMESLPCL